MSNIKTNIFLNEYYDCNSPNNPNIISRQKINCKHWSVAEDGCTTICSLKVLDNPSWADCAKCEKRECSVDMPVAKLTPIKITPNAQKPRDPSFFEKALSYSKAEISQFAGGKVSEEVFNKRKELCMSCDYRVNVAQQVEPIGWCKGGCGCKIGNPRSSLSQKLYMPTLSCPLKKFGPEKGEGFNITDALDSVKGVVTAVTETLKTDTEENK